MLTENQIQQLFAFTQKKYVRYYDLQCELVDHLASRIEELMTADEKLSFDHALQKVYADFGIFGFSKIVQEKENQMYRTGRSMGFKELRSLFRWPNLVVTLSIAAIIWQIGQWLPQELFFYAFLTIWFAFSIYSGRRWSVSRKKMKKNLLILSYVPDSGFLPFFFFETMILFNAADWNVNAFCIIAFIGIIFKMASLRVYSNLLDKAGKLYPEAFS